MRDLLEPVSRRGPLSLSDAAASPPKDLPTGTELEEKLEKQLDRLGELQQIFYADSKRALLIVLQGRDASGKDGVIRTVFGACNPQGVRITSFKAPTSAELAHDYLWRIHNAIPEKGMIGIFNRSHYEDVLVVRVHELVPQAVAAYRDAVRKCSTRWAPWYVVPADKNKARNYLIARKLVTTLEGLNLSFPKPKTDLTTYLKVLREK